jgi:hypothetical protein
MPPVILNKKLTGLPPNKAPRKHLTATTKKASLYPSVSIDNKVITLASPSFTPGGAPGIITDLSTMLNAAARATNKAIITMRLVLDIKQPHRLPNK